MENNLSHSINKMYFIGFIRNVMASKLFLTICLIQSLQTVASIVLIKIDIFKILFNIFFWMSYVTAKRAHALNINPIRYTCGVIKAIRIILWIFTVIIGVCGLLMLLGALRGYEIIDSGPIYGFINQFIYSGFYRLYYDLSATVMALLIILVAGLIAVYNILFYGNLHKFAKSVYNSAAVKSFLLEKVDVVSKWLLVLGILSGVGTLRTLRNFLHMYFYPGMASDQFFGFMFFDITDLIGVLSTACHTTVFILGYVLLKKYFLPVFVPVSAQYAPVNPAANVSVENHTDPADNAPVDNTSLYNAQVNNSVVDNVPVDTTPAVPVEKTENADAGKEANNSDSDL